MTNLLAFAPAPTDLTNGVKLPESPFFWLPVNGSTTAESVDGLFNYIYWVSVICVVLLLGLMIGFVLKYRAKDRHSKPLPSPDHHSGMELIWSTVPVPVLLAMFAWGFQGFVDLRTTPKDAYEIHVTGQKWKWLFEYPNGYSDDVLHVPVGRKVRLVMTSVDVVHSFGLPAFRTKEDVVPGRYTELWFDVTQPGEYPIFCDQYCGQGHSAMITRVVGHAPAEFDAWLKDAEDKAMNGPPMEVGEKTYNKMGCAGCHSVDGSAKTGPTYKGLFGRMETLADGSQTMVDENYIRESIMEPQAKMVKGFPPAMPTFKGKLKDKQITALITFIQAQK